MNDWKVVPVNGNVEYDLVAQSETGQLQHHILGEKVLHGFLLLPSSVEDITIHSAFLSYVLEQSLGAVMEISNGSQPRWFLISKAGELAGLFLDLSGDVLNLYEPSDLSFAETHQFMSELMLVWDYFRQEVFLSCKEVAS